MGKCVRSAGFFLLVSLVAAPASAASIKKIMPLGDSITDGKDVPGSYRTELWRKFAADGLTIDFVGSLANGPAELGDKDHEGHGGFRIDQIASNVTTWMNVSQPDIILLLIGTNDVIVNYDLAHAPARLSALLDAVAAARPGADVLVGSIPPFASPVYNARAEAFNDAIPGIVGAQQSLGRSVDFVDIHGRLTADDLYDGVHPDAAGCAKMAEGWYPVLRARLGPPPLSVRLTRPAEGAVISWPGDVTLEAKVSDFGGTVARVEFFAEGDQLGEAASPPYRFVWRNAAKGRFTLGARVTDTSGNTADSGPVHITLKDITAPTLNNIALEDVSRESAAVSWETGEPADAQVEYGLTDRYGIATVLDARLELRHSLLLTPLTAGTTYHYRVKSADADGNRAVSADRTFATRPPDLTRPTVRITVPGDGAVITGRAIRLAAEAADDERVAEVRLFIDDALVAKSTSPPYEFFWDTASADPESAPLVADGPHRAAAQAFDASGNSASHEISLSVDNGLPVVALTAPASGAVLYGEAALTAQAQDAAGVVSVRFQANGADLGPEDTAAPFTVLWDTTLVGDGDYSLTAVAKDLSGHAVVSSSIPVSVAQKPEVRFPGSVSAETAHFTGNPLPVQMEVRWPGMRNATPPVEPASSQLLLHFRLNKGSETVLPMRSSGQGLYTRVIDVRSADGGDLLFYGEWKDPRYGERILGPERTIPLVSSAKMLKTGNTFESPHLEPSSGYTSLVFPDGVDVPEVRLKFLGQGPDVPPLSAAAYELSIPGRNSFTKPAELTLAYLDSDGPDGNGDGRPDGSDVEEGDLKVFWHDGSGWRMIGGVVDPEKNTVTAMVRPQWAMFALMKGSLEGGRGKAARETFLSPALTDGINDLAVFGSDAREVTIYDANGQVQFHEKSSGENAMVWDGRSERGSLVPSGAYIARVQAADGSVSYQTFAVVR
ncbi:MAG: hypothetical protein HY548_10170 [Elusimicrobia bacterium]|nr:hypothetical protein [Elusimicrobiota bacterium]